MIPHHWTLFLKILVHAPGLTWGSSRADLQSPYPKSMTNSVQHLGCGQPIRWSQWELEHLYALLSGVQWLPREDRVTALWNGTSTCPFSFHIPFYRGCYVSLRLWGTVGKCVQPRLIHGWACPALRVSVWSGKLHPFGWQGLGAHECPLPSSVTLFAVLFKYIILCSSCLQVLCLSSISVLTYMYGYLHGYASMLVPMSLLI